MKKNRVPTRQLRCESLEARRLLTAIVGAAAPVVQEVLVRGRDWTPAFLENLQFKGLGVGGYSIPANTQLATLPWTNIDQVRIRFDQDVVVQESQLSLRGVNVSAPSLAVDGFSYDPATFTATWTLAAPLPADKVQLALSDQVFGQFGEPLDGEWSNGADSFPSGNGVAGGPFIFRLNSLPADGDRSGKVDTKDGIGVRQKLSPVPSAIAYSPFFDFNGDSRIDATDGAAVQANLFKSLPAGEPVLPTLLVPDLSEFIAEDTLLTLPVSNLVDRSVGGIGVVTLSGVAAGPRHGTATVTGAHLLYAPDLNYFGEDSFQYVLTSSTGQTSVGTVFVSVAAVNDPPINVLPYIDNDYRGWSVYNRNAISVSDVDAGEAAIKVKLSIDGFNQGDVPGKLFLYSTEGLVVSGNDTPSLEITGPVSAINAALNYGLDFTQSPRHPTDALLTMISDDLNGLTDTDYREIFIPRPKAVFDDVEVNQNSTGIVIDVLRNDFGNEGAQVVLLSFTQPAVGGTVTLVNNGAGNTDDELKFVPDRGFVGVSSFTYTINDSLPPGHPSKGLDSIGTVWVTVNPIYEPSEGFNIAVPGGSVYLDPTLESASGSDELGLGKVGVTALTPAPVVQEVLVRGHDWTPAFLENLQFKGLGAGGYSIPANAQLATLPWNNIDQIRIRFDQDVVVQENQLSIRGVNVSVPAFAVNGFSYDSTTFTATWTLAAPLPADKVQLALSDQVFGQFGEPLDGEWSNGADSFPSGNGVAGGPFIFRLNSLTADGDRSGKVDTKDGLGIRKQLSPSPQANNYSPFFDFNADGRIDATDASIVQANPFKSLPAGEPPQAGLPQAENDNFVVAEDSLGVLNVLANDTPSPGATLIIKSVTQPTAGSVMRLGNSLQFTPLPDFNGSVSFTYVINDSSEGQTGSPDSTATVTVVVTAVNDAPTAIADSVSALANTLATYPSSQFLANDLAGPANEFGQHLRVTSVNPTSALGGTVAFNPDTGMVTYTPPAGVSGNDSFSYEISDDGQTNGINDFKTATGTVSVVVRDFRPSVLSGIVYVDETNDGIKQNAERSIGGVVVTLSGTALGNPISMSTITAADGHYAFNNLAPGTYTVSFVNPPLMIDGLDTPGNLGDADGVLNNNSFSMIIAAPGGLDVSGYNFGVLGVSGGYATTLEGLASRYFVSGSAEASKGIYAVVGADGSQKWFSLLNGYEDVVFAEIALNTAGTQAVVTIVDRNHAVFSAVLGQGRFLTLHDNSGNTIIRILGGREVQTFTLISLAAPPLLDANRYLDAIDAFFAQSGW